MTIEQEPIDEAALFDEAVSDEPEAPVADVADVPEKLEPEPVRDEAGRFAKADEPDKPAEQAVPDDRIPQWRREEIAAEKNRAVDEARQVREQLAVERSQREELQRRLAAMEKPAPAKAEEEPDPLLDPKGYRDHIQKQIRDELLNDRREESLARAHKAYKEEFQEAYAAAQKQIDPALKARMQASRDPGETLIEWHREIKAKAEVGTDLKAYKQRLREEALKDPEFRKTAMEAWRGEAATQTKDGRPRIDLGPSLNGASRSNASLRSAMDADVDDDSLFEQTTA
jgi:DNA repair exonuclease SbcCD ATPase subunit